METLRMLFKQPTTLLSVICICTMSVLAFVSGFGWIGLVLLGGLAFAYPRWRRGVLQYEFEKNAPELTLFALMLLVGVGGLMFVVPDIPMVPNPNYDPTAGEQLFEDCYFDGAGNEICGEGDLNPEFIQGSATSRLLGGGVLAGAVCWIYSLGMKRIKSSEIRDAMGRDLSGKQDLSKKNLSRVNLRNRYLSEMNFEGANLQGAILSFSSLRGSSLKNADLRGARLVGADLSNCDLTGADLTGAVIRMAKWEGARLPEGFEPI